MAGHRTFAQKVGAGFAVTVLLTAAIGAVAVYALSETVRSKDRVITVEAQQLVDTQVLRIAVERKVSAFRAYLLNGGAANLERIGAARTEFTTVLTRLRGVVESADERGLLDAVAQAESQHQEALEGVVAMRQAGSDIDTVAQAFEQRAAPARDALDRAITAFVTAEQRIVDTARQDSTSAASRTIAILVGLSALVALLAVMIAVVLTRGLSRQIGTAVGQVQTSSTELETAATQQAAGAKEEATAMSEITTTINELLVTSRQIAESAQRVAQIAEETATAARSGDDTIVQAQTSIAAIRRQVDLVVHHMVELGQKSQQIGAVLDIVSEHAEQTNILAINATIEATGAGEAGKRFAVVADEIRKLADRVAGSAKEIRGLIDDVRTAVNTTVMATETGSKAVDTGSRQFTEVAAAFQRIGGMVSTTTEAAREIELSTKQQASAVEQVNVAVADVAQATRATEASSAQTRQTASQLVHARTVG
jgi:CHASE3 domain sensor protein